MPRIIKREGKILTLTAGAGGVNAGDLVVVASGTDGRVAVALETVAENGKFSAQWRNVVVAATAETGAGQGWAPGQKIYWDGSQLTATSTDNTYAGRAVAEKTTAAAYGEVSIGEA